MVVVPGKAEVRIEAEAAIHLRAPSIWIVIVANLDYARAVGQLANRTKMVARAVIIRRPNLLTLRIKALRDVVAPVALFTRLRVARAPDELFRARYAAVGLLHNLHPLT